MTDTAIIRVLDSFPLPVGIGREKAAQVLVNYWPEIGEHFAREVHKLNAETPAGSEHYQTGWSTAIEAAADTIRNES